MKGRSKGDLDGKEGKTKDMAGNEVQCERGGFSIRTFFWLLQHGLDRVLEKKYALFWHIKSFDRYIKETINPLGLRV